MFPSQHLLLLACTVALSCGSSVHISASPIAAQEFSYKLSHPKSGTAAVDFALVVPATHQNQEDYLWLQILTSYADSQLKELEIGTLQSEGNRFCIVQYGGQGDALGPKLLEYAGNAFVPYKDFYHVRRQLQRNGEAADGYQAIDFALKHAPFRSQPNITKIVVFVTHHRRTVLESTITNGAINSLLRGCDDAIFATVVSANFTVGWSDSHQTPVLGIMPHEQGIEAGVNFDYSLLNGQSVAVSSREEGVVQDYVNLTLNSGGVVWGVETAARNNITVIKSLLGALFEENGLRKSEICERCWCEGGTLVEGDCDGKQICHVDMNQQSCFCHLQPSPTECSDLISPSPVHREIRSTETLLGPSQTPIVLQVNGSVVVREGGDVDINFSSNKAKANFDCVLLNDTDTPIATRCTSPFQLKSMEEGKHQVLVIARRKGFYAAKRFDFEIGSDSSQLQDSELKLTLTELPEVVNGSIIVSITVRRGSTVLTDKTLHLMCSTGGGTFHPCTSPFSVGTDHVDPRDGLLLVVVAVDNRNSVAMGMKTLVKHSQGPVVIHVQGVSPPDPFGRVQILFTVTGSGVNCLCRTNDSRHHCVDRFEADPLRMGSGPHNLSIVCMDDKGYSATQALKVYLPLPPPAIAAPLSCNLTLLGPTPHGKIVAIYHCDRRVMATCQVSGLPAEPCNNSSGVHEVDVKTLDSGLHLFILNIQDGYGKSVLKLHQFTVGTAHRKCCPVINTMESSLATQDSLTLLQLDVVPGNCTESEGFSYDINWGDGTSDMGLSHTLVPVALSKLYGNTTSATVQVAYCNNPVLQENKCCDHATFHHSTS